jgi:hypothetical protein
MARPPVPEAASLPPAGDDAWKCANHVNDTVDSNHKGGGFKQGRFFRLQASAKPEDKAKAEEGVEMAIRLSNPHISFTSNADCVACHLASRNLFKIDGEKRLLGADGNPDRYKAPAGVTAKFDLDKMDQLGAYSVRAFGWGFPDQQMGITLYTLNDTLRVASEVNFELLAKGLVK